MKNSLFSQLRGLLRLNEFETLSRHDTRVQKSRKFGASQHFLVMFFAQIKGFSTLRETVETLQSQRKHWYHLGLKSVARSTISDANRDRNSKSFRDYFYHLLGRFNGAFPSHRFRFKNKFFSIDSTTISLSLELFPWAKFRQRKGGIKLHTLLDNSGYLPSFIHVTEAKQHDSCIVNVLPQLDKGSILAFDRAYINFEWFQKLKEQGLFFVTRAKSNMKYKIVKRNIICREKGISADYEIELKGKKQRENHPGKLRIVKYIHPETGDEYVYLTNIFHLAASTIAECYKERWQIELFFKWIKQNLKIKSFYGTSKNAVMIQIYTALIYLLLVSFLKFRNKIAWSMKRITRVIREKILDREELLEVLKPPVEVKCIPIQECFL